jgi:hypothetical protein
MTQKLSPRSSAVARALYDRHAGAVTVLMNMMFVRHFIGTFRAFDGDLVAAIVLGEVAHHNLASVIHHARTPHELSEALRGIDVASQQALLPTNAFSVAQATGIPRETVRRKVASLTRRGWLVKDARGNLFVADSTRAAFATSHVERLEDLLETAHAIETLLRDRQPARASRSLPHTNGPRRDRRTGQAS